ncbi:hypothetical protein DT075_38010 [Bacillus licheniformis]|nr:hypothetical protein DT075_38010 [Bacillus licheniformis]
MADERCGRERVIPQIFFVGAGNFFEYIVQVIRGRGTRYVEHLPELCVFGFVIGRTSRTCECRADRQRHERRILSCLAVWPWRCNGGCPAIAIATAAVKETGQESKLFSQTVKYSLVLLFIICIWTFALSKLGI